MHMHAHSDNSQTCNSKQEQEQPRQERLNFSHLMVTHLQMAKVADLGDWQPAQADRTVYHGYDQLCSYSRPHHQP